MGVSACGADEGWKASWGPLSSTGRAHVQFLSPVTLAAVR